MVKLFFQNLHIFLRLTALNDLTPPWDNMSDTIEINISDGCIVNVPIKKIRINESKLRQVSAQKDVKRLKGSIKQHGVLVPLAVTAKDCFGYYILVDGLRRLLAAIALNLEVVPCYLTKKDPLKSAVANHYLTKKLTPIELAKAFHELIISGCKQ